MKTKITILVSLAFSLCTMAQQQFENYKEPLKIALKAQKNGNYTTATEHYAIVMEMIDDDNSKKAIYHRDYGIALLYTQQLVKAIDQFDQALNVGKATFKDDEVEDIKGYKRIAMSTLINTSKQTYLMANPVDIEITNVGKEINSEYDDCCISYSTDELSFVFTSRRKSLKGGKANDGQYSEDLFYATRTGKESPWSEIKNLGNGINTKSAEHTSFILQNSKLAYFDRFINEKEAKKDGYGGNVDIFLAKIVSNTEWVDSTKLSKEINTPYWDAHPFVTEDGNTLFFASDRPGGNKGRDLYYCTKDESGKWSEAVNLGDSINTEFDEVSPFVSADGNTLFFSSNGLPGIGGFDVFRSLKLPNGKWSKPINMGYPINTDARDVFFRLQGENEKIYIASNRKGGNGELDLYSDGGSASMLALGTSSGSGKSYTDSSKIDSNSNVYNDNTLNGDLDSLSASKSIDSSLTSTPSVSASQENKQDSTIASSDNTPQDIEPNKESDGDNALAPSSSWEEVKDISILFDFNDANIRDSEFDKLDQIVAFLLEHPTAVVEVSGHTDGVGSDLYNVDLSVSRVKQTIDYLIKGGINANQFYAKCQGESQPIHSNDSDVGRQKNRRVSFKILGDADVYVYEKQPKYKDVFISQDLLSIVNSSSNGTSSNSAFLKYGEKSVPGLVFKIQVGAFRNPVNQNYFSNISELQTNKSDDGITRYTSGEFSTINEAKARKNQVATIVPEAFITAYQDGERIPLTRAISLLK